MRCEVSRASVKQPAADSHVKPAAGYIVRLDSGIPVTMSEHGYTSVHILTRYAMTWNPQQQAPFSVLGDRREDRGLTDQVRVNVDAVIVCDRNPTRHGRRPVVVARREREEREVHGSCGHEDRLLYHHHHHHHRRHRHRHHRYRHHHHHHLLLHHHHHNNNRDHDHLLILFHFRSHHRCSQRHSEADQPCHETRRSAQLTSQVQPDAPEDVHPSQRNHHRVLVPRSRRRPFEIRVQPPPHLNDRVELPELTRDRVGPCSDCQCNVGASHQRQTRKPAGWTDTSRESTSVQMECRCRLQACVR
eukprot:1346367-Rhodomonas_salina.1